MRPEPSELAFLFDRAPIGMYRTREDGTFLQVNRALARMLGYDSVDELLTKNLNRDVYVDPDERPRLIASYRSKGIVDAARARWKRRDGRELVVLLWGHVVETTPPSFYAWVIDVTAREAADAELRRTAAILDLCMRQMPAMYWIVDRDLRIVRSGGAIEPVLGIAAGTYVGKTLFEVDAETPNAAGLAAHERSLHGEIVSYDHEFLGKHLQTTTGPYRDASGAIIGAIGTCIDVTATRQLERRMIDAQRAESLGVLAGGLAHDFNNLLVAVLGSAELGLRELGPGARGRSALENIRTAGLRAAELTQQLLAYAGRGGAGSTRISPASLVEELVRIVAPTMPEQVRVTVDISPELALRGDPAQVRQVLLNLVQNARDALAPAGGTIAISARAIAHDGGHDQHVVLAAAAGDYVRIAVADDGAGIDRETLRHAFEPFFTTKPTGHGLGLAAVLGIVRAHGGGIRVVSEPGRGATFEVLWPAAPARMRTEPARLATAGTVLVVDDEDLVRETLARMIEELGYGALTAADGRAALAVLDERAVDAVILDLTMPGMSGAELAEAVRARRPGVPLVLCSGFDRDGHGPVAADAYLPKPFRIDALQRMLAKVLARV